MVADSWFRSLWKFPRKREAGSEKAVIGVLAFEVASLMSKLVHLWQSLSDKQVIRLREEITNSVGIKKLVSEDEDFIVCLICSEMTENMEHVAKSVARLAKKCSDPALKSFENAFDELMKTCADPCGWQFTWKKMERKVKKMERFISANATLYQEMEILADLEQSFRRLKAGGDAEPENLLEFQKKVGWKKHEVKNLQEISLWNRTYDYTIHLLARSLFTIFYRIKHVFGISQVSDADDSKGMNSDFIHRSHSVSGLMHSSVHPSETSLPRFSSGPLGRFITKSGPVPKATNLSNFYSGPLVGSTPKLGLISRQKKKFNFYSGPLGKSTTKSGPIFGTDKTSKMWQTRESSNIVSGKKSLVKLNRLTQVGPFKGGSNASNGRAVTNNYSGFSGIRSEIFNGARYSNVEQIPSGNGRCKLLDAPADTLGAAALALHYANVIIVIEKLAASPHLIGHDARDDLYNMLPASVRAGLRERLKPYTKELASSVYDTELAGEWTEAMTAILEWLAPLAHNMIRWQSERSYEQQSFVSRTNVLLVQTLYFANQEKTEATITELLVGLNYIWRFGRELNAKALHECASSRIFDECLDLEK